MDRFFEKDNPHRTCKQKEHRGRGSFGLIWGPNTCCSKSLFIPFQ